jgi:hypothetical protein
LRHGLAGGVLVALCLRGQVFALYVFPGYQLIYGAFCCLSALSALIYVIDDYPLVELVANLVTVMPEAPNAPGLLSMLGLLQVLRAHAQTG